MKKTDIHLGIASYILTLKNGSKEPLSKKEEEDIQKSLFASLSMLDAIPEPIDEKHLANAIANLLAYIVSNGKSTYTEKCNHLSDIVLRTRLVLEMEEQPPVAEVLDYIHEKKKHPLIRLFNNH